MTAKRPFSEFAAIQSGILSLKTQRPDLDQHTKNGPISLSRHMSLELEAINRTPIYYCVIISQDLESSNEFNTFFLSRLTWTAKWKSNRFF